ncbi:MAG: GNAT family N-acetyltransferase [Ruminococcus sp.]|nr:GNAT family N-acetyltransferase [Ruminococcus sp.]
MTEIKRLLTDEELRSNAELAASIWREHFTSIITPEQIEYMLEQFQSFEAMKRQTETEHYEYYGFFLDGEQQGYFAVADKGDGTLFLSKLYLRREARGKGYASRMFDRIKEIGREKGLSSVWLTVNRRNDSTVAVYRHWGMEVIREQCADIGDGFVMDDYVFSLPL